MNSHVLDSGQENPFAGATILVVDDDRDIRYIMGRLLSFAGYRVLTAANAEEAVRLARETRDIHLVITDIEMPGIRGDELGEWFQISRPDVPVIYMSGNPIQRRRFEGSHFISKPFASLDRLLETMRGVLEQSQLNQLAATAHT